ncbi:MAG: TlpA family protein disulfide reductase [Flavobacteriia bacterium]|nr:TlpA family protein disulfide reductase [Flavobacteriia bacterium]
MKRILFILSFAIAAIGAEAQIFPNVQVKTMDGQSVDAATIEHDGPVVVSFWATWCSPCKKELDALSEYYLDLVDETNVKVIAISIDDPRTVQQVINTVNSKAWDYDVYLDTNSDLKRAMGVNNVPHTMVYNSAGELVYTSNKYAPGDEYHLMEVIREAAE